MKLLQIPIKIIQKISQLKNPKNIHLAKSNRIQSSRSLLSMIKTFLRMIKNFLLYTKSGKVIIILLAFMGYVLFKYYNAYYEIICQKNIPMNLEILRHLKANFKDYNPTFYIFHPMLSVAIGESNLHANFVIKFSKQVNQFK